MSDEITALRAIIAREIAIEPDKPCSLALAAGLLDAALAQAETISKLTAGLHQVQIALADHLRTGRHLAGD